MTRLTASGFFFCLLASSAWANGIKHPSNYGDPSFAINFPPCSTASQTADGVVASCFQGTGPSPNDFLFTFSLQNPSPSTSITSVTFTLTDIPTDFGLLEGTALDCASMNIACTPAQVTITNNPALASPITLDFSNFTGGLSGKVTAYFAYDNTATAPSFTSATTSSTTATPEPGEVSFLIAALSSLIIVRRRWQAKQNS